MSELCIQYINNDVVLNAYGVLYTLTAETYKKFSLSATRSIFEDDVLELAKRCFEKDSQSNPDYYVLDRFFKKVEDV